jgi:hypothetical protein
MQITLAASNQQRGIVGWAVQLEPFRVRCLHIALRISGICTALSMSAVHWCVCVCVHNQSQHCVEVKPALSSITLPHHVYSFPGRLRAVQPWHILFHPIKRTCLLSYICQCPPIVGLLSYRLVHGFPLLPVVASVYNTDCRVLAYILSWLAVWT